MKTVLPKICDKQIFPVFDKDGNGIPIPALQGPQGSQDPADPVGDGTGDMLAATYDPQGIGQDIFSYAATASEIDEVIS